MNEITCFLPRSPIPNPSWTISIICFSVDLSQVELIFLRITPISRTQHQLKKNTYSSLNPSSRSAVKFAPAVAAQHSFHQSQTLGELGEESDRVPHLHHLATSNRRNQSQFILEGGLNGAINTWSVAFPIRSTTKTHCKPVNYGRRFSMALV